MNDDDDYDHVKPVLPLTPRPRIQLGVSGARVGSIARPTARSVALPTGGAPKPGGRFGLRAHGATLATLKRPVGEDSDDEAAS